MEYLNSTATRVDQQLARLVERESRNWTVVAVHLADKRSIDPEFENALMFVIADVD